MPVPKVEKQTCARLPLPEGEFELCLYKNGQEAKEHLALTLGDLEGEDEVLVRIHSECFTGDVLGSLRCDCGPQLHLALERIRLSGRGILIYLRQEGRGIGLLNKLRAYNLQDQGYDTVEANLLLGYPADDRDYGVAAAILRDLGVQSVQLMTNNPSKIEELRKLGMDVTSRVPLETGATDENEKYLQTKASRMNHLLNGLSQSSDVDEPFPIQINEQSTR